MTELKKHIENSPIDSKDSILALIEFKTDSDMEKVLDKITGIEQRLESKITGIEQRLESKIQGLKANMDTQYRMLLWTVGVGISFIAVLMAFFQLLK